MANKMTRIEALNIAITTVENAEVKEILGKMAESIAKHNSTSSANRKPSARQLENKAVAETIKKFLEAHAGEKFSIAELKTEIAEISTFNPQRVAPILSKIDGIQKEKGKVTLWFIA